MSLKRIIDVLLAGSALLVLSPVLGLVALAVRRNMGSPVLFRQVRPGYQGKPFRMCKFRTMRDAQGPDGKPLPDSERLTRLGRFLRATSLDELPELWNVLKGDMSLVGPRPLLTRYLPYFSPVEARRFNVLPGITGWAQVRGRNDLPWDARLADDVWYVDNRSLALDLKILALTVWSVVEKEKRAGGSDHNDARPRRGAARTRRGVMSGVAPRPPGSDGLNIRRVTPGECDQVLSVHRAALPRERVALTIYNSPRAANYLASVVGFPSLQVDRELWGAWDGATLAGYAHFRTTPDGGWHLNHLAVRPGAQRNGVGRTLWDLWLERGRLRGFDQVSLDVDEDNAVALDWYTRRGLRGETRTWTYARVEGASTGESATVTAGCRLVGWDAAEAWQATYGFSRFTLAGSGGEWEVGRLGESYFRVAHPFPEAVEAILRTIDPRRGLLVVSGRPLDERSLELKSVSLRMRRGLAGVKGSE